MSLPAADDLFRPTGPGRTEERAQPERTAPERTPAAEAPAEARATARQGEREAQGDAPREAAREAQGEDARPRAGRTPSGRVRHDEKMTVYVTSDEMLDLEHARLSLRRLGMTVDRGRLVRAAVAIALADLDAHGDESALVQRLMQR